MTSLRVGIDSYCLSPLQLQPNELLKWAAERGGEGVQFSEGNLAVGEKADDGLLSELSDEARFRGLYLEWGGAQHVPFDTTTWRAKDLLAENRRAAESASKLGAHVVRSCSGGFFRWTNEAPRTSTLLGAMAAVLRSQRTLFEDCGVTLAIELHFEFTTFELLRLFDMCDAEPGGWLGICLDTFNMLPMLEDPVAGTERVLPWIVATHVKDGGVSIGTDGLVTFPTELGCGLVDIPAILNLLVSTGRPINLSIEDHGGSFTTPLDDEFLVRFPNLSDIEKTHLLRLASAGGERLANGTLSPTDRAEWPELCQERTEAGLSYLHNLVTDRGSAPTAVPG